ncbi:MAG TPA: hypothetical protein VLZ07_00435 [Syntrophales bacterium]|nr:hypothetical protein [Syntrophales bacterium]
MKFEWGNGALGDMRSAPRSVRHLAVFVLLVGLHSLLIGVFIFFFTELFYRLFLAADIENFFFVRQAGLFLFCLGLFNLAILKAINKFYYFVKVIIATKIFAFLFLATHAHLAAWPTVIMLAAVGDGAMAVVLLYLYRRADFSAVKN